MGKRDVRQALKGQVKPHGGVRAEPMLAPTDEQLGRCEFVTGQVREEGVRIGFAYRRRPLIESMADKIGLTVTDMAALRYFRSVFDQSEVSGIKSCLDVGAGGGGGNGNEGRALAAAEANLGAKLLLARCEAAIGAVLPTMRAVVLFDRSFSQVAMDRYGSRKQEWLLVGEEHVNGRDKPRKLFSEKLVPKSGRHREAVADEFKEGTRRLVAMLSGFRAVAGGGNHFAEAVPASTANPISNAIGDAIVRFTLAGKALAVLWIAPATLTDLAREQRVSADDLATFNDLPVCPREDWHWGWMLCEPVGTEQVEGGCAGATEMA